MQSISTKSKVTTALLCFFLGAMGAHRFYVGRNLSGAFMLIIFIFLGSFFGLGFFIAGIWALVDFIVIISGKFKDKHELEIVK